MSEPIPPDEPDPERIPPGEPDPERSPSADLPTATPPRRTHVATPWINVARLAPALVILAVVLLSDGTLSEVTDAFGVTGTVATIAAGVLAIGLLVGVGMWLAWRYLTFFFDEAGDLRVASGVLSRRERRLQLSRLQSVDVERPLLARLVGLSSLRVEVAGAGDSRVELQYLSEDDAERLRAEVLARAAGLRPDAGRAPERLLTQVSSGDLAGSLLRSGAMLGGLFVTVLVIAVAVLSGGWESLVLLLVTGGVPLIAVASEFLRYFDFTIAESPDGIRLRHGLTTTQSQTVPPGRVHAVEVVEPLLWRSRDWVRVKVTVAGAPSVDDQLTTGVLIPVASRDLGMALVDRVLPGLDLAALDWSQAPARSRWRAPWQWRRLSVAADGTVVATRGGRFIRWLAVVPHTRAQSVGLVQGPWQRWLRLASVRIDVAPGPITVMAHHLDAEAARAWADREAVTARLARQVDAPQRWMSGQHPPGGPDPSGEPDEGRPHGTP